MEAAYFCETFISTYQATP